MLPPHQKSKHPAFGKAQTPSPSTPAPVLTSRFDDDDEGEEAAAAAKTEFGICQWHHLLVIHKLPQAPQPIRLGSPISNKNASSFVCTPAILRVQRREEAAMASLSLCLPLCVHRLHWQAPQGGLRRCHPGSSSWSRCARGSVVSSPPLLHLRVQEGTRICCSASASGDAVPPDAPLLPEAANGSVRSARWKSQVWVAVGVIGVLAIGLAALGVFRRNYLMANHQREASEVIAGLSSSPSSLQAADQFTVNWFGRKFSVSARSPGYVYFLLLMAAGFGLFVSEEALNVWVGGTLGRMLIWDQSRDIFLSSISANLPYIASTIIWVYCDLVPFYAGRQAAKSGTGKLIREKLGVSQEKFDRIKANVQRYGNLIGIVERFSLGVRNPTSFLAGYVGINPTNFFAGVCVGALITLPLQMGVGLVLRDRPVAALAGVAAVVGIWTLLPYTAAGIGSVMYIARRGGRKESSESVE